LISARMRDEPSVANKSEVSRPMPLVVEEENVISTSSSR